MAKSELCYASRHAECRGYSGAGIYQTNCDCECHKLWFVRIFNIGMPDYALDAEFFGQKRFKDMCYFIDHWVSQNQYNFVKIRLI